MDADHQTPRPRVAALVAAGAAAVAAGTMLAGCSGSAKSTSSSSSTSAETTATSAPTVSGLPGHPLIHARPSGLGGSPFPSPPLGAVVFGGNTPFRVPAVPNPAITGPQSKTSADAVGLAVIPEQGKLGLQASVVDEPTGGGAAGLTIGFRLGAPGHTTFVNATPCGPGCYAAIIPGDRPPPHIAVTMGADQSQSVDFVMPATWPAPPANAQIAHAERVWHALHTLVWHDDLSAGGAVTVHTVWKAVGPNRLSFRIHGSGEDGLSQVIIGPLAWFKQPGQNWPAKPTPRPPVHQPVPLWTGPVDAHVLRTVLLDGRPAWQISFFDPGTPGWFTIDVDKQTGHTKQIAMIANVHFMHDVYGPFNAPISITPPTN